MGTPEFMAPEQISEPGSVDARADIYALGVILHYMLAGRTPFGPPFGRLPAHVLLARILTAPIPAIERSDVPDGVRRLVAKALAKDPDQRFPNMREMEGAVTRLLAGVEAPHPPVEGARSFRAGGLAARPSGARRPPSWIAAGVAALLAVVAVGFLLRGRASAPAPSARSAASPRPLGVDGAAGGPDRRPGPPTPALAVEVPPAPGQASPPSAAVTEVRRSDREAISRRGRSLDSAKGARAADARRRGVLRRGGAAEDAGPAPELPAAPVVAAPPLPPARDQPNASVASNRPAPPAIAGTVDPALSQALVRSRLPEIERCYDRGKMDDPELKGRVTVRIHIAPSGVVTADELESSSLANSGVESCILDAVRGWRFPAPAAGKAGVISYPFNLR
jgi:TonB family protein